MLQVRLSHPVSRRTGQSLSSEADSYSAFQYILSPLDSLLLPQDSAIRFYPELDK
jgi:hypothetical protein